MKTKTKLNKLEDKLEETLPKEIAIVREFYFKQGGEDDPTSTSTQ